MDKATFGEPQRAQHSRIRAGCRGLADQKLSMLLP
jgi:hypothetical protein